MECPLLKIKTPWAGMEVFLSPIMLKSKFPTQSRKFNSLVTAPQLNRVEIEKGCSVKVLVDGLRADRQGLNEACIRYVSLEDNNHWRHMPTTIYALTTVSRALGFG